MLSIITMTTLKTQIRLKCITKEHVLIDMERLILDQFPNPDTILSPDGVHLNRTGNDFYFMAIGRRIARSLAG